MKRILFLLMVLFSIFSFGLNENIAHAYGSRPYINYNVCSDKQTSQNYSMMYRDNGEVFMLMTMGNGYSKTCVIVDEKDIDNMRRGRMDDNDLAMMSHPCKNYKFGNNIHCVYRNGEVEFVVICNTISRIMRIYGRIAGESEYLIEYSVDLLGVS